MPTDVLDRIDKAAAPIFDALKTAPLPKAGDPPPVPAPVTPPKVEPKAPVVDDTDIPAEVKSEQGKKSWRDYKAATQKKVDGYESRIRDMEQKIAASASAEVQAKLESRLNDLQKERDDLHARLEEASLERTPEFQRHYIEQAEARMNEAASIVPGKEAVLKQILKMPEGDLKNASLNEFLGDLNDLQRTELVLAMRELRNLERERQEKLKDARNQLKLKDQTLADVRKRESQESLSRFESELGEIVKTNALLQTRAGDEAWNTRVKNSIEAARELYQGGGTAQERARAALLATTAPVLIEQLIQAAKQIDALKAQVDDIRAKGPKMVDTKPEDGTATVINKAESLVERISRLAKEAGAVR